MSTSWAARAAVPLAGTIPSQLPTAPPSAPVPPSTGAAAYLPPWKRDGQAATPAPAPLSVARACEGVTLQPMRMADMPQAAPAASKASAPGAYVPPSQRKVEEAAKPTTLNVDDARAFPTFAAPGRPKPLAAGAVATSTLNFKKTIEERIVKDVEEAAALAKPKEEDPLKMTREELVADGWTVLDKPGSRRELAERFFAKLAALPPEDNNEDLDSMCPDGRNAFYDASFEPYKSPATQEQEAVVERIIQRKQQGLSKMDLLIQQRRQARARNGPGEAALWAAQSGAAGQIGSTDAEASAAALRRHVMLTA